VTSYNVLYSTNSASWTTVTVSGKQVRWIWTKLTLSLPARGLCCLFGLCSVCLSVYTITQ
jgi:hypothetical protein